MKIIKIKYINILLNLYNLFIGYSFMDKVEVIKRVTSKLVTKGKDVITKDTVSKAKDIVKVGKKETKFIKDQKVLEDINIKEDTNIKEDILSKNIYKTKAPQVEKEISQIIEKNITENDLSKLVVRINKNQNYRLLTIKEQIIAEKFTQIVDIFSKYGFKGCKNLNKYHEIIQMLDLKDMVECEKEKGNLPKDTTLHWVPLSYKDSPDLFLHWRTLDGVDHFRTIQLKSLNASTNRKFIYKLDKRYVDTDIIIVSVKDMYIKHLLSKSKKFDLKSMERINIVSIDKQCIEMQHNYIISIIMKSFFINQLEYYELINEFYRLQGKIAYDNKNNKDWNPLDIDLKLSKDNLDKDVNLDKFLDKDNISITDDISIVKEIVDKNLQLNKNQAAHDMKVKYVRLEDSSNKLGSHWYTSVARAEKYKSHGIKLTPGNILIGQSTGFDKF